MKIERKLVRILVLAALSGFLLSCSSGTTRESGRYNDSRYYDAGYYDYYYRGDIYNHHNRYYRRPRRAVRRR